MEPSARARTIIIGAVLMLTFSVMPAPLAVAASDVVLEDGEVLTSSIYAATITLPVGATVYYGADIVLSAEKLLKIEGQLRDQDAGAAHNIILEGGDLVITGNVIARDGTAGASSTSNSAAIGGAGTDGGSITISWPDLKTLTLADGARLQSGDGGAGGPANVTGDASSPRAVSATGGAGGRGGNIFLQGKSAFINGHLQVGNGGNGGAAETWALADRAFTVSHWANATGGEAASSGSLTLPPGFTSVALHNAGQLSGGKGGDGGSASGGGEVATAAVCGAAGYHSENDRETRHGRQGCWGENRLDKGADGADGLIVGGNGGSAIVNAGDGTAGGNGADGNVVVSGCTTYVIPGWGGEGGYGGYASAQGGDGGYGFYIGGRGGDATANGGDGGRGGKTGDGGRSPVRCESHNINCWRQGSADCFIDPAGAGCSHTGGGAQGGESFGYQANAGNHGGSLTGIHGGDGTATGTDGLTAAYGADGTQSCSHPPSHTHY